MHPQKSHLSAEHRSAVAAFFSPELLDATQREQALQFNFYHGFPHAPAYCWFEVVNYPDRMLSTPNKARKIAEKHEPPPITKIDFAA